LKCTCVSLRALSYFTEEIYHRRTPFHYWEFVLTEEREAVNLQQLQKNSVLLHIFMLYLLLWSTQYVCTLVGCSLYIYEIRRVFLPISSILKVFAFRSDYWMRDRVRDTQLKFRKKDSVLNQNSKGIYRHKSIIVEVHHLPFAPPPRPTAGGGRYMIPEELFY
jgi:hypothetical protein